MLTPWHNPRMKAPNVFALAILLLLAVAAGLLSHQYIVAHRGGPRPETDAVLLQEPTPLPAFSLRLTGDLPFDNASLTGHWSLLYFGYTHCPDACPTTLSELDRLLTLLKKPTVSPPQVYFVSVDPKRDGLDLLRNYTTYFNPTFLGATGDLNEIRKLTGPLGVDFSYGPVNKAGDYEVVHAAFLVLVNPKGEETAIFMPPLDAARMATDYRAILKYYGAS